uniref:Uncharacterized protein n=1 Tax=Pipistrellus kuhlii TaxID=59472 RepID=A0A7J7TW68_PIPKU|nr:hypothetical protein mPipKuh1_009279 [Pipistrellus kuhlii]
MRYYCREWSHNCTQPPQGKGNLRPGGCERSGWDWVCRGSGERLKAKSDALMCVKTRALCNKNYSEPSNYQLSPSHQRALHWLHFRCCLQGQSKGLLQGKKLFYSEPEHWEVLSLSVKSTNSDGVPPQPMPGCLLFFP